MTDVLNACPICGNQHGHCRHTTEGQVTQHPSLADLEWLAEQAIPTRPEAAAGIPLAPSAAAQGGADLQQSILEFQLAVSPSTSLEYAQAMFKPIVGRGHFELCSYIERMRFALSLIEAETPLVPQQYLSSLHRSIHLLSCAITELGVPPR